MSAKTVFEFGSKHFLMFSAMVIVVGVLGATVLVYGYLSAFDWRLIWIIEYPDVLKVGLVALAIVSGFSVSIAAIIDNAIIVGAQQPQTEAETAAEWKRRRSKGLIVLGIIGISLIAFLGLEYWFDRNRFAMISFGHLSIAMLFSLVLFGIERARHYAAVTPQMWVQDFFSIVLFVYLVGATIGHVSKETPGFTRDVSTLHGDYRDVGLVLITSRYVVLFRDGHSLALPVSEVTKIEARPKRTTH